MTFNLTETSRSCSLLEQFLLSPSVHRQPGSWWQLLGQVPLSHHGSAAHLDPEGCGSLGIALHPPGGSDTAAALIMDGLSLNERVTFNYIMLCVLLYKVICRFIYFNSAIYAVH